MFPMLIFLLFNNQNEPHKENNLIFINSHFSKEFYIERSDFLYRNFLIESTNSASVIKAFFEVLFNSSDIDMRYEAVKKHTTGKRI